jgi:hypothetical protein
MDAEQADACGSYESSKFKPRKRTFPRPLLLFAGKCIWRYGAFSYSGKERKKNQLKRRDPSPSLVVEICTEERRLKNPGHFYLGTSDWPGTQIRRINRVKERIR